jgi:hypothetical protein
MEEKLNEKILHDNTLGSGKTMAIKNNADHDGVFFYHLHFYGLSDVPA